MKKEEKDSRRKIARWHEDLWWEKIKEKENKKHYWKERKENDYKKTVTWEEIEKRKTGKITWWHEDWGEKRKKVTWHENWMEKLTVYQEAKREKERKSRMAVRNTQDLMKAWYVAPWECDAT